MDETALDSLAVKLADHFQRSVTIDDLFGRILAWELLDRNQDPTRIEAVFSKHTAGEAREWEEQNRAFNNARKPCLVPSNTDLKYRARLCLPLVSHGRLLAYAWILARAEDDDISSLLDAAENALRALTADLAALYRTQQVQAHRAGLKKHMLPFLDGAIDDLDAFWGQGFQPHQTLSVLVARPPWHDTMPISEMLTSALGTLIRRLGVDAFWSVESSRMVIVCETRTLDALVDPLRTMMSDVERPESLLKSRVLRLGISSALTDVSGLRRGFSEAIQALQAQEVDPGLASPRFEDLGPYQFFKPGDVFSGRKFLKLMDDPRAQEWVAFLERIFDSNQTMGEVARQMNIHRTTLYDRIGRIAKIVGDDPLQSHTRLDLHMSIKFSRWENRTPFT